MSPLVLSIIRDLIQKLLGVAFAYAAVHGFNVPANTIKTVDNWAVLGIIAALLTLWTTIVRSLEERKGASPFDVWCRTIGRVLMLGIKTTPVYPPPPKPEPTILAIEPSMPPQPQ